MVETRDVIGVVAAAGASVTVVRYLSELGWTERFRETITETMGGSGPAEHAPDNPDAEGSGVVSSGAMEAEGEDTTMTERGQRREAFASTEDPSTIIDSSDGGSSETSSSSGGSSYDSGGSSDQFSGGILDDDNEDGSDDDVNDDGTINYQDSTQDDVDGDQFSGGLIG